MAGCRHLVAGLLCGAVLACGDGSGTISAITPVVSVSGFTRDYFTSGPLPSVAVTVDDHPTLTATSGALGSYSFSVSSSSTLRAVAALTSYRPTRNETMTIGTGGLVADLFAVSLADANRQYTAVGLTPNINTGVVIVNLRDDAGQPRVGIPVADIVLLNGSTPVGLGPYVFTAGGDVVPQGTQSVTVLAGGRSRVAFLDVPGAILTLSVKLSATQTVTATVFVTANGATLVQR